MHSSAVWYAGSAFLAPQQFLSPTYPHDFPGRFPAFIVSAVGSEENTKASRFGNCTVYLAPTKRWSRTVPNLRGWRLRPFLTVQLLPVALSALQH